MIEELPEATPGPMYCAHCHNHIKEGVCVQGAVLKIIDGEVKGGLIGRNGRHGDTDLTYTVNMCSKCFVRGLYDPHIASVEGVD